MPVTIRAGNGVIAFGGWMRKRLRKKKHLGEFQEFGVELAATLHVGVDVFTFLDDFLCDAVEANQLQFGGGGSHAELNGFIELGRREVRDSNLAAVTAWLAADPRVSSFNLGTPVDAWYGPF